MKYLIAGLGNIGHEYANTRHNIGFTTLDALAGASGVVFSDKRYGMYCETKHKARILCLLKPSTYMNRSGLAIQYYLKKEKLEIENLLVVVDDVALPFGTIRLKAKGGSGGHNGLQSIIDILGTDNFARLRFGIGDNFGRGQQSDYVLGEWTDEELEKLPANIDSLCEAIKSFCILGIDRSMNYVNTKT